MSPSNSWFGIHLYLGDGGSDAKALIRALPGLSELGINALILEVDYNFAYDSHPELRGPSPIQKADVRQIVQACRAQGIRLIPQFQCLGHQSWAKHTHPLLVQHPEFDETPGQFPNNEGIYCRSWCPRHPAVNPIVFSLFSELLETFEADALHVGMDEVFLIASPHCPRCQGGDPGEIFAQAVNDYYDFLVRRCGVEMQMWGDRLLDARQTGYGEWEAAENGTHTALAHIPRDIILCDWHYTKLDQYPSIPYFIQEGFSVWPGGWREVEATQALLAFSRQQHSEKMLGHLCTTWGAVKIAELGSWPPILAAAQLLKQSH